MTRKIYYPLTFLALSVLVACSSTPSGDISLIPTQTDAVTQTKGAFTQPLKWSGQKPGCQGQCPSLEIDALIFPGQPELTKRVDQGLAAMLSQFDTDRLLPTLDEYRQYYWQVAGPADETIASARAVYRNKNLTTIELSVWKYYTGAAHGMSATQYLNWSNQEQRPLTLDDLLEPRQKDRFIELQKQAHQQWLQKLDFAQDDPQQYLRQWPFQPTDNIAITDAGLLLKYQPYEIAPYAAGMPQMLIPYEALKGVLKRSYLPERQ